MKSLGLDHFSIVFLVGTTDKWHSCRVRSGLLGHVTNYIHNTLFMSAGGLLGLDSRLLYIGSSE